MSTITLRQRHLSLAVTLAVSGVTGASAATIQVDNSGGGCEFGMAIAAANTDSAVGACAAGSGVDLILLPQTAHFPNFAPPPPPITSDLTIRGHALGTSAISCEGGGQPIFIGDEGSAPNVVLEGFAILSCGYAGGAGGTGGGGAAGMGGAVFVHDGDVTLKSISISNASVTGGLGGSPFVDGGGGAGGGMHGAGGAPGASSSAAWPLGSGGGGGANASTSSIVPGGAAGAPNGGNGGTGVGFVPLPGAGGFGGGGGGGASLLGVGDGQDGANGGFGGGGGGGAATNSAATVAGGAVAGDAGDGGFGGGGGRGGSSFNATAGDGGAGGFGGGGGGRGYSEFGAIPLVGVSGFGAQAASSGSGGQGAAFGGALFVRAGTVSIRESSFNASTAAATNSLRLGGAIFVLDEAAQVAHNAIPGASRQGMPEVLPMVTGCSVAFSGNSAASQAGTDSNNHDVYGTSRVLLVEPCKDIFLDGFE